MFNLQDGRIRLIAAPIIGLVIPHVTGLYGTLSLSTPWYWIGSAYFIFVSFVVWQGNLYFWRRWRGHPDWLSAPAQRLLLLISTTVLYTIPTGLTLLYLWYLVAGIGPPNWHAIASATAMCVMADIFIKNTYETVYLIRQRGRDLLAVERLERAKAQAELSALRTQIDPHFLFNCLNSLASLIEEDPERAQPFTVVMAEMYRYLLRIRNRELVLLREEVAFLRNYCRLLCLRFDDGIQFTLPAEDGLLDQHLIPPVALQLLAENAVKHNEFSTGHPLRVSVAVEERHVVVTNAKRPTMLRPTSRLGLRNLDERCRLLLHEGIEIRDDGEEFSVRLPLATAPAEQLLAQSI